MFFKPINAEEARKLSRIGEKMQQEKNKKEWERSLKRIKKSVLKDIKKACAAGREHILAYNVDAYAVHLIGYSHPIYLEVNKYLESLGYNVTRRVGIHKTEIYYDISWAN